MSIELQERRSDGPPVVGLPDGRIAPVALREEERTKAIGRELFARMDRQGGRGGLRERVYDAVMQGTMRDEALKTQLFRLIDVLPVLRTPEQVARHVREHLLRPELRLPAPARVVLKASERSAAAAALVAWAARFGSMQMAHRFIAGADLEAALATAQRLRRQRLAFTLDLLGEAVISESEAEAYAGQYLRMIHELGPEVRSWTPVPQLDQAPFGPVPRLNVSLKLSSLTSHFDPMDQAGTAAAVKERLRPILTAARAQGAFVNVDMEQYAYKETTLRIFREVMEEPPFRDWPDVGIVLQAYLRDTEDDLEAMLAWAERRPAPVWVRLVKGAYWDTEVILARQHGWPIPVYTDKAETDANYERLTDRLLAGWEHLRPAIAGHNVRSVSHALARAEALGLPPGAVEFQTLYGLGDRLAAALSERSQRVRIYLPFGELIPGLAYLVRRLLENTASQSFVRLSGVKGVERERLLERPLGKLLSTEDTETQRTQRD
jgi:RHH-type transcriptional regulator, proline utilization regulon repressor / proline dehydrogenase / delta 1-pyrroline-5-carboxylate dehydrogenase